MADTDTVTRLLDVAERLCRTRGYNSFSFRDLAEEVGIRSASIHYHFPTKADLGKALVLRYRQRFEQMLAQLDRQEPKIPRRLEKFVEGMKQQFQDQHQACLCGMFAAESATLPQVVRDEVTQFFRLIEGWIERQLSDGRKAGVLKFEGEPSQVAAVIVSSLQGMLLTARTFADEARLSNSAAWLMQQFAA